MYRGIEIDIGLDLPRSGGENVNSYLFRGIRNVKPQFPDARFIVFGSRSRGDANAEFPE
jgi:hypothetical protein